VMPAETHPRRVLAGTLSQQLYWRLLPWLNPGLENSHLTYARILQHEIENAAFWLDLGCGRDFVPDWVPLRVERDHGRRRIAGVDMDLQALQAHNTVDYRVLATGEGLPFADGTFDLVTMNMVLEHVQEPLLVFEEVFRVLKPGGAFLVHTPNRDGYTTRLTQLAPPRMRVALARMLQGRQPEDVYPTFYRANTAARLYQLAVASGLLATSVQHIDSSPLFVNFAPLLIPEMLFIRLMRHRQINPLRACLLASFQKPAQEHD
jgi:ubiquinone/menaquinone biosynthesis C-methylase UbiE